MVVVWQQTKAFAVRMLASTPFLRKLPYRREHKSPVATKLFWLVGMRPNSVKAGGAYHGNTQR